MHENIINIILGIFLTALLGAFFASFIPRKLKERDKFIEAADELRKCCDKAVLDLADSSVPSLLGRWPNNYDAIYDCNMHLFDI